MSTLFENLKKDSHAWANEEEVRKRWLKHIENETCIKFHAERGRNDTSYNQITIEFKDRGLFKGVPTSPAFREAIFDRLAKYIPWRAKAKGIPPEDYIGIATDGNHISGSLSRLGKAPGASASIPDTLTPDAAKARVTIKEWEATPVSGGNTPWAIKHLGQGNRLPGWRSST